MRLVRILEKMGEIGQSSCWHERNWLKFLKELVGLVRIPTEWVGLVRILERLSKIGETSSKHKYNWSEFLKE